jgi:alkylation response protein AidB-like acyl-CoA dehydrogenase
MLAYQAPERDLEFLLFRLFKVQEAWREIPAFAELTDDLVRAVISEGGKLASQVMTPINQHGDAEGSRWKDGVVTAPSGFQEAYDQLAGGGWLGLSGDPQYGGQGMPKLLGCLLEEMFWGSNSNLYLYATLTVGASICINVHGTEEQKSLYLPMLYSGQWSGAMDLTEPHAGTDLGIIRTKAEQVADGSYRITGTKIFITAGEHDLTENIVHLVLAKLPGAPEGTRGISLFIVPKFVPDADGSPGERNAVTSGSIEEKMGVKGSATNVMNYDGAVGYLVGEENSGLACMFTMMNYERLSVGLQGLGSGELAYQQAVRYARDRLQGRAPSGPQNPEAVADSLLVHPDVRRMLLTIRAYTEAGRAFAMVVGLALDRGKYAGDQDSQALSELLTPIAKAFLTDKGFECAVLAQQVFGGHGYIKESGVEQIVRDTRIAQIYEGTNGVQALDLVGRKVLRDGGQVLKRFVEHMAGQAVPDRYRDALSAEFERLLKVTESVLARAGDDADLAGAVSTDYLELVGLTIYAWLWGRMVEVADDDAFGQSKRQTADFFFARLLPKTLSLEQSIYADSSAVMAMHDAAF